MRRVYSGDKLRWVMALRLLIVDDNLDFLEAARGLLDGDGISVVGIATTLAEGLRLVGELEPDVTLVDVDLGEESGFEFVRRLTAMEVIRTHRVILTSAYTEEDFAELVNSSPAIGFLPKADLSVGAIAELIG